MQLKGNKSTQEFQKLKQIKNRNSPEINKATNKSCAKLLWKQKFTQFHLERTWECDEWEEEGKTVVVVMLHYSTS